MSPKPLSGPSPRTEALRRSSRSRTDTDNTPEAVSASWRQADDDGDAQMRSLAVQAQRTIQRVLRPQPPGSPARQQAISVVRQRMLDRQSQGLPMATFREKREAAVQIQAVVRGWMTRRRLFGTSARSPAMGADGVPAGTSPARFAAIRSLRRAAARDSNRQTAIRIVLAARHALAEEKAAVRIQSAFRGYWTRLVLLRQQELRRRIGATHIQSTFRGRAWRSRLRSCSKLCAPPTVLPRPLGGRRAAHSSVLCGCCSACSGHACGSGHYS